MTGQAGGVKAERANAFSSGMPLFAPGASRLRFACLRTGLLCRPRHCLHSVQRRETASLCVPTVPIAPSEKASPDSVPARAAAGLQHKIHFAQMFPRSLSHGKLLTVHVHLRCAFRQGPTPNRDQRFLQSHGHSPTAPRLSIPIMDGSLTIAGGVIRCFSQLVNGIGAVGRESADAIAQ
jgi:hypothetical protein